MPNDDSPFDEKKLFREVMQSVTPLKQQKKRAIHKPSPPTTIPPRRPKETPAPSFSPYYLSNSYPNEVSAESILDYSIPNLPKKKLLDLRKGNCRWQSRLDLHGLTTSQASDKLGHYISQQFLAGHRYVLIVHGKGSPTADAPVLKNHVNHWLQQLPEILAFHSATPRDGGSGALYVWLRANDLNSRS